MSPFTLIKIALKALLRNRMCTFLSALENLFSDVAPIEAQKIE